MATLRTFVTESLLYKKEKELLIKNISEFLSEKVDFFEFNKDKMYFHGFTKDSYGGGWSYELDGLEEFCDYVVVSNEKGYCFNSNISRK